jgi:hypothetical protein
MRGAINIPRAREEDPFQFAPGVPDQRVLPLRVGGQVTLPRVDPRFLTIEHELHNPLVRKVLAHHVVRKAVKMRKSILRVAASDELRHAMLSD